MAPKCEENSMKSFECYGRDIPINATPEEINGIAQMIAYEKRMENVTDVERKIIRKQYVALEYEDAIGPLPFISLNPENSDIHQSKEPNVPKIDPSNDSNAQARMLFACPDGSMW